MTKTRPGAWDWLHLLPLLASSHSSSYLPEQDLDDLSEVRRVARELVDRYVSRNGPDWSDGDLVAADIRARLAEVVSSERLAVFYAWAAVLGDADLVDRGWDLLDLVREVREAGIPLPAAIGPLADEILDSRFLVTEEDPWDAELRERADGVDQRSRAASLHLAMAYQRTRAMVMKLGSDDQATVASALRSVPAPAGGPEAVEVMIRDFTGHGS